VTIAAPVVPVAPIAAHPLLIFLLQIGTLGLMALALGRLAVRIGLPPVVGELCAGVLLGPSLLGTLAPHFSGWLLPHQSEQTHLLDAVGQIGVLLLVGITGTEMDFKLVKRRGTTAVRISLAGLIIPFGLGIGAGFVLPATLHSGHHGTTVFALFLGVAMCVSAIPVIAKTMIDMNLLHRNIGQLTLAAGVIDDVIGWFLLSLISAIATVGFTTRTITLTTFYIVLTLGVAALPARLLFRKVLRAAGRSKDPAPTIAVVSVAIMLSAAATQAMGFEGVFGAFVCGAALATCGALDRKRIAALRSFVLAFLAPLFFATAGLRIDLTALRKPTVLMAALLILTLAIAGKFAGAYLGGRSSRLTRWESLALGAGMNARGVIEVVIAMVGLRLGVLSTETYTIIVLVAVITSVMAPPMLRYAMKRVEQTADEELRLADLRGLPVTHAHEAHVG
jgi:Kef-type K+ transport system membrane component KefB